MDSLLFCFRYNDSEEKAIDINPYEQQDIGIELYSLSIVRNVQEVNWSYIKKKMKNKELTRYAIVVTNKMLLESYERKLRQIFAEFWQRQILNVIIIFWTNELNCFTYSPFVEGNLIPLNVSETESERLFFDKLKNLNGHEIRIGLNIEPERSTITRIGNVTKMSGIDGDFGTLIMARMNATFRIFEPLDGLDLGETFENGSANGIFAMLKKDKVDMSFNARFFRFKMFRGAIEPTVTLGRDDVCILVPRTGISLNLDNIFDAFELPVWILFIAALPIYALFFQFYHRKRRSFRTLHSFSHTFLRLFGWTTNQPYMYSPRTTLAKVVFGLWILYSAFITQWYNSNLTSYLMVKPRLPDITTLQQLEQSNYQIFTQLRYSSLLDDMVNKTNQYQNLFKRLHNDTIEQFVNRTLSKDTSYAYAHKEHLIRYLMLKGHLFDTFALMRECPVPFITVYGLSYGSPYKGRINWIMSQARDSGIINYWLGIGIHRDKMNQFRHFVSPSEHHVPISISHLQTSFYILLFGCIISLLVFLYEINLAKRH